MQLLLTANVAQRPQERPFCHTRQGLPAGRRQQAIRPFGSSEPATGGSDKACKRATLNYGASQCMVANPTVILTRNVSSPVAIGTEVAMAAGAACARMATGGT